MFLLLHVHSSVIKKSILLMISALMFSKRKSFVHLAIINLMLHCTEQGDIISCVHRVWSQNKEKKKENSCMQIVAPEFFFHAYDFFLLPTGDFSIFFICQSVIDLVVFHYDHHQGRRILAACWKLEQPAR